MLLRRNDGRFKNAANIFTTLVCISAQESRTLMQYARLKSLICTECVSFCSTKCFHWTLCFVLVSTASKVNPEARNIQEQQDSLTTVKGKISSKSVHNPESRSQDGSITQEHVLAVELWRAIKYKGGYFFNIACKDVRNSRPAIKPWSLVSAPVLLANAIRTAQGMVWNDNTRFAYWCRHWWSCFIPNSENTISLRVLGRLQSLWELSVWGKK